MGRMGVTINCSMVPISFSRTMASAVSISVTIMMMLADHARHEIVAAVQVGVEPHAAARRHLRRTPRSPAPPGLRASTAHPLLLLPSASAE